LTTDIFKNNYFQTKLQWFHLITSNKFPFRN
jgi:hypothetical protein